MTKLIIVLIILLGIIAIAQLTRVYELSAQLRNKREEDIPHSDNKLNAGLMLVFMFAFYASFIYLMAEYGMGGMGPSATKHGEATDWLMNLNMIIIITVFFITNTLLFVFANKYYYRKDRKALYFPHNNKLELLWTIVPASVLFVIIFLGLKTWNEITDATGENAVKVEIYSKQFGWIARYAGDNNELGHSDFRLVSAEIQNALGVATKETIDARITQINAEIKNLDSLLKNTIMPDMKAAETKARIDRMRRHLAKVMELKKIHKPEYDDKAYDDFLPTEIHLLQGQEYEFTFRSQDVIHSAYFPHLRMQMNTVPGMTTRFKFVPIITTDSMRTIMNDDKFDFVLLCNKICGASHYNMQMKVVIEKKEAYEKWWKEQKTLKSVFIPEQQSEPKDTTAAATATALNNIK
jgi:cytochrome c oxidase subunit 2